VAPRLVVSVCLALFLTLACGAALGLAAPPQPLTGNPAHRLDDRPRHDGDYDHASACRRGPSPGALALQEWLTLHVRGTSWGIVRCEKLSRRDYSLHAEGRALDWHLDASDPTDRRAARRLIDLLLATDSAGNEHALARRMGIQEIIWNCRSWWAGSERMGEYSVCFSASGRPRPGVSTTLAHRDHIHLGLSRAGAAKRTSFWR
jgi:hypothetical protein